MLFGAGKEDMAAYAAALPLEHEPGMVWNYSSGTTNIYRRIIGDAVGDMPAFLADRLVRAAGDDQRATDVRCGGAPSSGSSYVHATARDFATFGELYRNDGVAADGVRVTPPGWTRSRPDLRRHRPGWRLRPTAGRWP